MSNVRSFFTPCRADLRFNWEILTDSAKHRWWMLMDCPRDFPTNFANRNPLVSCFSSTIFDGRSTIFVACPTYPKILHTHIYSTSIYSYILIYVPIYSRLFHCIPLPTDFPQDPVFEKLLLSRLKADDLSCLGRSMGGKLPWGKPAIGQSNLGILTPQTLRGLSGYRWCSKCWGKSFESPSFWWDSVCLA